MGLYVGNTRIAPVVRVNVTPNFKGVFNLITDLGLNIGATESDIATALATEITTAVQYDYCLVEIPDYQVYNGYSSFVTVDAYVGYYVIYNSAYELVTNANKSSLNITPKTTVAYILNNAYSVVRYNFDGTDWTSSDNSGYANIDASNFTDSGTTFLSGLGMPDYIRYEELTLGASGSTYVAPANGWFLANAEISNNNGVGSLLITNITNYGLKFGTYTPPGSQGRVCTAFLPVLKGDSVVISTGSTTTQNKKLAFIYAEGNPTPPQP